MKNDFENIIFFYPSAVVLFVFENFSLKSLQDVVFMLSQYISGKIWKFSHSFRKAFSSRTKIRTFKSKYTNKHREKRRGKNVVYVAYRKQRAGICFGGKWGKFPMLSWVWIYLSSNAGRFCASSSEFSEYNFCVWKHLYKELHLSPQTVSKELCWAICCCFDNRNEREFSFDVISIDVVRRKERKEISERKQKTAKNKFQKTIVVFMNILYEKFACSFTTRRCFCCQKKTKLSLTRSASSGWRFNNSVVCGIIKAMRRVSFIAFVNLMKWSYEAC